MKLLFGILIQIVFFTKLSHSQVYGDYIYSFLSKERSAKSLGLGHSILSDDQGDVSFNFDNPALLNEIQMNRVFMSQSFNSFFLNSGTFSYVPKSKFVNYMPYVTYRNYGEFQMYDENGFSNGTFNAMDFGVGCIVSKELSPQIRYGIDIELLGSYIENYSSIGIKFNTGILYKHKNELFSSSISLRNFGRQLKSYNSKQRNFMPLNLSLGSSYKLKHAPFKFSVVLNELNNWNNIYTETNLTPTIDILTGDTIPVKNPNILEQLGHHLIFQSELFLSKKVTIRGGFDYHKRDQSVVALRPGMAGFSFGFGIRTEKFEINYGMTVYSKAAQTYGLSLSIALNRDKKKFLGQKMN